MIVFVSFVVLFFIVFWCYCGNLFLSIRYVPIVVHFCLFIEKTCYGVKVFGKIS